MFELFILNTAKLFICATPLGNLQDISFRLLEILKSVDLILSEDTRVTQKILNKYQIQKKVITYNEHHKQKLNPQIINWLKDKKKFFIKTTEEIFQKAFQIIKIYPELIKNLGLNNNGDDPADPYLISTAIILNKENIYGEAQIKIITEEGTKKNHIPDIANKYNIKSLHILEFFKENNWQF